MGSESRGPVNGETEEFEDPCSAAGADVKPETRGRAAERQREMSIIITERESGRQIERVYSMKAERDFVNRARDISKTPSKIKTIFDAEEVLSQSAGCHVHVVTKSAFKKRTDFQESAAVLGEAEKLGWISMSSNKKTQIIDLAKSIFSGAGFDSFDFDVAGDVVVSSSGSKEIGIEFIFRGLHRDFCQLVKRERGTEVLLYKTGSAWPNFPSGSQAALESLTREMEFSMRVAEQRRELTAARPAAKQVAESM